MRSRHGSQAADEGCALGHDPPHVASSTMAELRCGIAASRKGEAGMGTSTKRGLALVATALACVAGSVQAVTPQEDEDRIEALLKAERARERFAEAEAAAREAPVIAAAVATPVATPNDDWLAPQLETSGMPFDDLARAIGRRVEITTEGRRRHRGVVLSANAQQVTLQVARRGGAAVYTLKRAQVARIDPL